MLHGDKVETPVPEHTFLVQNSVPEHDFCSGVIGSAADRVAAQSRHVQPCNMSD